MKNAKLLTKVNTQHAIRNTQYLGRWSLVFFFAGCLALHAASRPGKIQFSNGEVTEGNISLTAGAELEIHLGGTQIRTLALDKVREIRLAPEKEEMVQKWRFPDAGQNRKEKWGQPYPTRDLKAAITLASNEKITGHLYTTVLYVEGAEKTQKVILYAKQSGEPGQTLASLIYPTLIQFADAAAEARDTIRLRLPALGLAGKLELAALNHNALLTYTGSNTAQPNEFRLTSPLGQQLFLAAKAGDKIVAGWPKPREERGQPAPVAKLFSLVQTNLAIAEDFFDDRNLLGVWLDQANSDLYSLVMLARQGKTTLDAAKSQPWRLVILRWKYDDETQRVMLAGRGYFFRGILEKGQAPPKVQLTEALWGIKKSGDVWVTGAAPP